MEERLAAEGGVLYAPHQARRHVTRFSMCIIDSTGNLKTPRESCVTL